MTEIQDDLRRRIPPDQFLAIDYEEFCDRPWGLVERLMELVPELRWRAGLSPKDIEPFEISNRVTNGKEMNRIESHLMRMGL